MRTVLWCLWPALALVLLAAHFLYGGLLPLAVACLMLVGLLFVPQPWAARVLQAALLLGSIEWVRRAWVLAAERMEHGQPYLRMLLILGGVAVFTACAAVVFRHPALRARHGLGRRVEVDVPASTS